MIDAEVAILQAQCIVRWYQQELWMREHPEVMAELQAQHDAMTPMQRLQLYANRVMKKKMLSEKKQPQRALCLPTMLCTMRD